MANPEVTMTMPSDLDNLRERLRRDYDEFSPAQQALARYVADHIADLPLMSAHEVARSAHCSPATVVRFAQALGFNGYPDLQQLVRRDQRPWLPVPTRDHRFGVIGGADSVTSALAAERHALEDTADRLGQRGLGPVAQALAGRRPVVVAGDGHARLVVGLLVDRLARIGVAPNGVFAHERADRTPDAAPVTPFAVDVPGDAAGLVDPARASDYESVLTRVSSTEIMSSASSCPLNTQSNALATRSTISALAALTAM